MESYILHYALVQPSLTATFGAQPFICVFRLEVQQRLVCISHIFRICCYSSSLLCFQRGYSVHCFEKPQQCKECIANLKSFVQDQLSLV